MYRVRPLSTPSGARNVWWGLLTVNQPDLAFSLAPGPAAGPGSRMKQRFANDPITHAYSLRDVYNAPMTKGARRLAAEKGAFAVRGWAGGSKDRMHLEIFIPEKHAAARVLGETVYQYLYEGYQEPWSQHRQEIHLYVRGAEVDTRLGDVAAGCTVTGSTNVVELDAPGNATVWDGAIVRGDRYLKFPFRTNVQFDLNVYGGVSEGAVVSTCVPVKKTEKGGTVTVDCSSLIGNNCVVLGADIGESAQIGHNSVLMPGSKVGQHAKVAAGSVVESDQFIPDGELWGGKPARFIRHLSENEKQGQTQQGEEYFLRRYPAEDVTTEYGDMDMTIDDRMEVLGSAMQELLDDPAKRASVPEELLHRLEPEKYELPPADLSYGEFKAQAVSPMSGLGRPWYTSSLNSV